MIYLVAIMLLLMFLFQCWVFEVMHNMVQGLYFKLDETGEDEDDDD